MIEALFCTAVLFFAAGWTCHRAWTRTAYQRDLKRARLDIEIEVREKYELSTPTRLVRKAEAYLDRLYADFPEIREDNNNG